MLYIVALVQLYTPAMCCGPDGGLLSLWAAGEVPRWSSSEGEPPVSSAT